jgi:hypothetical protein
VGIAIPIAATTARGITAATNIPTIYALGVPFALLFAFAFRRA